MSVSWNIEQQFIKNVNISSTNGHCANDLQRIIIFLYEHFININCDCLLFLTTEVNSNLLNIFVSYQVFETLSLYLRAIHVSWKSRTLPLHFLWINLETFHEPYAMQTSVYLLWKVNDKHIHRPNSEELKSSYEYGAQLMLHPTKLQVF